MPKNAPDQGRCACFSGQHGTNGGVHISAQNQRCSRPQPTLADIRQAIIQRPKIGPSPLRAEAGVAFVEAEAAV